MNDLCPLVGTNVSPRTREASSASHPTNRSDNEHGSACDAPFRKMLERAKKEQPQVTKPDQQENVEQAMLVRSEGDEKIDVQLDNANPDSEIQALIDVKPPNGEEDELVLVIDLQQATQELMALTNAEIVPIDVDLPISDSALVSVDSGTDGTEAIVLPTMIKVDVDLPTTSEGAAKFHLEAQGAVGKSTIKIQDEPIVDGQLKLGENPIALPVKETDVHLTDSDQNQAQSNPKPDIVQNTKSNPPLNAGTVQTQPAQESTEMSAPTVGTMESTPATKAEVSSSMKEPVKVEIVKNSSSQGEVSGAPPQQSVDSKLNEPARLAEAHRTEVVNQVARGIESLGKAGQTSLRLQLHPETLGKIDLRMISNAEGVRISLTSDQAVTGTLLERYLPELRQILVSAGVNLTGLTVGQQGGEGRPENPENWQPNTKRMNRRGFSSPAADLDQGQHSNRVMNSTSNIDYRI